MFSCFSSTSWAQNEWVLLSKIFPLIFSTCSQCLCQFLGITSCPHQAVSRPPLLLFNVVQYAVVLLCSVLLFCHMGNVVGGACERLSWAIYSLCSPELGRLTAGLLAAAAAAEASVFVSPLLSNTSRIQQGPTSLTYALNQQVHWQVQAHCSEPFMWKAV